jgi:hypothetical protein
MYVTVGSTSEPPRGFTWRVWPSRTSFYLKSRAPGMGLLKLSLHGDDPRHPGLAGFKIGMDGEDQYQAAVTAGEIASIRSGDWPMWFPGKDIGHDALLVVRLRWTWDACTRLPPAPPPGELKKDAVGLVAPPPPGPGDAGIRTRRRIVGVVWERHEESYLTCRRVGVRRASGPTDRAALGVPRVGRGEW